MSEEEQNLFEDSIKLVRENFNAKTNQLPEHLLMLWIIPCREDYVNTNSQFQFLIFMTIYSICRMRNHSVEWGEEYVHIDINIEDYVEKYSYFQSLLHFEHMRRLGIMNYKPIDLFYFDKYDDDINVAVDKHKIDNYHAYMEQWLNEPS